MCLVEGLLNFTALVFKASHLSGFAFLLDVPEWALGWFPLARLGIGKLRVCTELIVKP